MGKTKKLVKSDVLADMLATKTPQECARNAQERARNAVHTALVEARQGWVKVSAAYRDGVKNECIRLGRLEKGDPALTYYYWRFEDDGGMSLIHMSLLVAPEAKRLADEILAPVTVVDGIPHGQGLALYPKTYPVLDENGEPHPKAGQVFDGIDMRIWVETVRACLALVKAATGGEIRFRWNDWYKPGQPGLTVVRVERPKLDAAA